MQATAKKLRDEMRAKQRELGKDHPLYWSYQDAIDSSFFADVTCWVTIVTAVTIVAAVTILIAVYFFAGL